MGCFPSTPRNVYDPNRVYNQTGLYNPTGAPPIGRNASPHLGPGYTSPASAIGEAFSFAVSAMKHVQLNSIITVPMVHLN